MTRVGRMGKVLIIGTGDMAKGCPGKLGDGLIVGALAAYMHDRGLSVHLVTNLLAGEYLQNTYAYPVSVVDRKDDIPAFCKTLPEQPERVVIVKPKDDPEADEWNRQLIRAQGIPSCAVLHIGDLEAFDHNQHIIRQLAQRILPPFGLEIPSFFFPEVYYSIAEIRPDDAPDTLVLPVAGSLDKQLSSSGLEEIYRREEGSVRIAGTRFKSDTDYIRYLSEASSGIPSHIFMSPPIDELLRLALYTRKIVSADSGLLWLVTAFLNHRVSRGLMDRVQYPEIVVVHKDHKPGVPAFNIWYPLLMVPQKLKWLKGD